MHKLDKDKTNNLDWTEFKTYLKEEKYAEETFVNMTNHLINNKKSGNS
jgi:hypothetical protein